MTIKRLKLLLLSNPKKASILLASIFLTLIAGWLSCDHLMQIIHTRQSFLRAQYALTELQSIQTVVESVGAGLHGYLLFDREDLLYPIKKASSEMESSFERLSNLIEQSPADRQSISKLRNLTKDLLKTNELYIQMENIESMESMLGRLVKEKQSQLSLYSAKSDQKITGSLFSVALLVVVAILGLVSSAVLAFIWHTEKCELQQIQLEKELEIEWMRMIIQGAPIGIVKFDHDLNIVEANPAFIAQTSMNSAVAPLGQSIWKLVKEDQSIDQIRCNVIEQGKSFQIENLKLGTDDKVPTSSSKYLNLTAWPLKDSSNAVCGGVLLSSEVSERVRLMELRDDVLATIAHDLKVPLLGMDTILELFLNGSIGVLDQIQSMTLFKLRESNTALIKLVKGLVEVYKYESDAYGLDLETVDLVNTVRDSANLITPMAESKNLSVTVDLPDTLQVSADSIAIMRVVSNLLDNAMKFSREQGTIEVSLKAKNDFGILEIKNDCDSIPFDLRDRLFQRFYQVVPGRRSVSGAGLGLYMCRKIVESHSGTIECLCPNSTGVIFRVTLPLLAAEVNDFVSVQELVPNTFASSPRF